MAQKNRATSAISFIFVALVVICPASWPEGTPDVPDVASERLIVSVMQPISRIPNNHGSGGLHGLIDRQFGIELHFEYKEDKSSTIEATIAAGEMTDVLSGFDSVNIGHINRWGPDGLLYPIDTILENKPALGTLHIYTTYPESMEYNTAPDGHIYNIPGGYDSQIYYDGVVVRRDLLEQVGFDVDTVDDFSDYTKMLRELWSLNDGNPVISTGFGVHGLLSMPFKAVGLDSSTHASYDDENDRFFFPFTSERARFAIEWISQLYEEGIIHPDSLDQSPSDWWGRRMDYPALLNVCVPCFYVAEDLYKLSNPSFTSDFVAVLPPKYLGERQSWRRPPVGSSVGAVLSSGMSKSKAERIVELLDWFRTDEGQATALFGLENEHWTQLEGRPRQIYDWPRTIYVFPSDWQSNDSSREEYNAWRQEWGYLAFVDDLVTKDWELADEWLRGALDGKLFDDYIAKYENLSRKRPSPLFSGDFVKTPADYIPLETELFDIAHEWVRRAIRHGFDSSDWESLQEQLDRQGVDRYEQGINDNYWNAKENRAKGTAVVHRRQGSSEEDGDAEGGAAEGNGAGYFYHSPTSISRIDRRKLLDDGRDPSIGHVNERLSTELRENGYGELRYHSYSRGFALASRKESAECGVAQCHEFTLVIVGDDPSTGSSIGEDNAVYQELEELIDTGSVSLDPVAAGGRLANDFVVTVLVYQFDVSGSSPVLLVDGSD